MEEKFKSMDWYYQYSDDHRHWSAGHKQYLELISEARVVSLNDLQPLVDKYVPKDMVGIFMNDLGVSK